MRDSRFCVSKWLKPKVAQNAHAPSPRALHQCRSTGAGRGQGEGQVPLRTKFIL